MGNDGNDHPSISSIPVDSLFNYVIWGISDEYRIRNRFWRSQGFSGKISPKFALELPKAR